MGIKSTVELTREEALERINALMEEASNEAIADVLETLNDHMNGGFDNYRVS